MLSHKYTEEALQCSTHTQFLCNCIIINSFSTRVCDRPTLHSALIYSTSVCADISRTVCYTVHPPLCLLLLCRSTGLPAALRHPWAVHSRRPRLGRGGGPAGRAAGGTASDSAVAAPAAGGGARRPGGGDGPAPRPVGGAVAGRRACAVCADVRVHACSCLFVCVRFLTVPKHLEAGEICRSEAKGDLHVQRIQWFAILSI